MSLLKFAFAIFLYLIPKTSFGQNVYVFNETNTKVNIYHLNCLLLGSPLSVETGSFELINTSGPISIIVADSNQFFVSAKPGDSVTIQSLNDKTIFIKKRETAIDIFFRSYFLVEGKLRNIGPGVTFARFHTLEERDKFYEQVYTARTTFLKNHSRNFSKYDYSVIENILYALKVKDKLNKWDRTVEAKALSLFYRDSITFFAKNVKTFQSEDYNFLINDVIKLLLEYLVSENVECDKASLVNSTFNNREREFLISRIILDSMNLSKRKEIDIDRLITTNRLTNSDFINFLHHAYDNRKLLIAAQVSGRALLTLNNTQQTLHRIAQKAAHKYIYVDLWASWCVPCKEELKFTKALKKSEAGNMISFLFISLDHNIDSWKRSQDTGLMNANSSFLLPKNFDSQFAKDLKIGSIPRYIIIDRNAKIIDDNAPPPSDKSIFEYLKKISK